MIIKRSKIAHEKAGADKNVVHDIDLWFQAIINMVKHMSCVETFIHSNRIVMDHDCARLINGPVAYVWGRIYRVLFQAGPPAIIFHIADAERIY